MITVLVALALQNPVPPITEVKIAPMAFFDTHCSRCHGFMGSFYGPTFAKGLDDKVLKETVRRMAAGPGGSPLAGQDLDALVAFHRSMARNEPFLVVTKRAPKSIAGEATPDIKIIAKVGGESIAIKLTETSWKLDLPAGYTPDQVELTGTLGKKTTKIRLSKESFSHSK